MTGRVDHQFDTKNSLFVRYSLNFDREFWPSGTVPESTTTIPGYGRFSHNSYQMAGLDWTHIFSPKLVNEFKLGYNRWQLRQSNEDLGNPLAANLGIMGLNQIGGVSAGVPDVTLSGYASIGGDPAVPETGAVNTFQIGDTLTHVVGTHTLSYGVDMRSVRRGNFTVDSNYRGAYGFTGSVTNGSLLLASGQVTPQQFQGLIESTGLPCAFTTRHLPVREQRCRRLAGPSPVLAERISGVHLRGVRRIRFLRPG